jgi:aminoglycoside phosphotransferase family enzyme/predicted kinase
VPVRETHISWVFLAGERAYKLKKPIVLAFLDYGTPERRRRMCAEEVRLNRRLASDTYLGVRAIVPTAAGLELAQDDDPRAIDYVVEMRRYEERDTLAATFERGELIRTQVVELAGRLARFHADSPRARSGEDGAEAVDREVQRNVEELLAVAPSGGERRQIRVLARFLSAFVTARAETFDARAARGCTRECHGDLRAEHVVLHPFVSVVDCVEFDVGLRTLDVADDLAFLIMDLAALGGEAIARELVDAYRGAGGDCGDDALLAFFAVHRALVRAKVLLVRAGQSPPASAAYGHASAAARELIALAARFAWRARMPLAIVLCGVPASGKSLLAAALAGASGWPHVCSDVVRKGLAGITPTERASPEHYGEQWTRATYSELGRRAAADVGAHGGVLVDATCRHRRDRDAFRDSFADAAPLLFVECLTPAEVLARRAAAREHDRHRVSDATLDVVMRERHAWEPLDEVPARAHLMLRSDQAVEAILTDLIALLDERLD